MELGISRGEEMSHLIIFMVFIDDYDNYDIMKTFPGGRCLALGQLLAQASGDKKRPNLVSLPSLP